MAVDSTWLLVTELYAIVAVVSLFALLAAVVVLVLKVRRTARQIKARVRSLVVQQTATASEARAAAHDIGASARRSAGLINSTAKRLASTLRTIGR
jgi:hypothetical protein